MPELNWLEGEQETSFCQQWEKGLLNVWILSKCTLVWFPYSSLVAWFFVFSSRIDHLICSISFLVKKVVWFFGFFWKLVGFFNNPVMCQTFFVSYKTITSPQNESCIATAAWFHVSLLVGFLNVETSLPVQLVGCDYKDGEVCAIMVNAVV